MPDEMLTHDNVIVVSFPAEASAYEALARLTELDSKGAIGLRGAAVVARGEDGRLTVEEQAGEEGFQDTAGGGLLGLLVGVLGGPLGVVIGGTVGLLVGSLFDDDEYRDQESVLTDMSKAIRVGPPGLIAEVSEPAPEAADAVMDHLSGTVVRRPAADVEAEIAAAEQAQKEATKKARKELREAREKQQKEKVDAKLAELKAKLPGHKHPAGAAA